MLIENCCNFLFDSWLCLKFDEWHQVPKRNKFNFIFICPEVQLKQGEECQFDCVPWFKVSIPRALVQIDQLNPPNLETEDLKIEFLNFDNGILAKFFFEKFENWNFNSEIQILPSAQALGAPGQCLSYLLIKQKLSLPFLLYVYIASLLTLKFVWLYLDPNLSGPVAKVLPVPLGSVWTFWIKVVI